MNKRSTSALSRSTSALSDDSSTALNPPVKPIEIDTAAGSWLHRLSCRYLLSPATGAPSVFKTWIAAVASTYLPLFVAARWSSLPIASRTAEVSLPFLYDWNVAFMFLVTFPVLLSLTLRDQSVLASSLTRVQADGVLIIPDRKAASLGAEWKSRFRKINRAARVIGLSLGAFLAWSNYHTYICLPFWIARHGKLLPVGFVYLWCIFLFYVLVPVYILRNIGISYLLKDVVAHAQISELPFHPDQSGGLRPVGEIGLRNQYGLTVVGVNIVILGFLYPLYLHITSGVAGLIAAAGIAYVIFGPLVFIGPLLPFRAGMLRTKTELMSEVAQRLRVELHRLRQQLQSGDIKKEDEEMIDRLRKLGSVIDQLPVWPFDFGTLRKFLSAYVTPLLGAALAALAKPETILSALGRLFKH